MIRPISHSAHTINHLRPTRQRSIIMQHHHDGPPISRKRGLGRGLRCRPSLYFFSFPRTNTPPPRQANPEMGGGW